MSGKVWKLTPQKAAFLEDQFKQKGGILIHSDGKFYSVDEWQGINRSSFIESPLGREAVNPGTVRYSSHKDALDGRKAVVLDVKTNNSRTPCGSVD